MARIAEQLEDARAEVHRLERMAAAATCAELGRHDWQSIGGCNCGCPDGSCSVPVHECTRCGDCDYGKNDDADDVRRNCPIGAV